MEKNESLMEYCGSVLLLFNVLENLGKNYTPGEKSKCLINGICAHFPMLFNDLSNKTIENELDFFDRLRKGFRLTKN